MLAAVLGPPMYPETQADEIRFYANGRENIPAAEVPIDGDEELF